VTFSYSSCNEVQREKRRGLRKNLRQKIVGSRFVLPKVKVEPLNVRSGKRSPWGAAPLPGNKWDRPSQRGNETGAVFCGKARQSRGPSAAGPDDVGGKGGLGAHKRKEGGDRDL